MSSILREVYIEEDASIEQVLYTLVQECDIEEVDVVWNILKRRLQNGEGKNQ